MLGIHFSLLFIIFVHIMYLFFDTETTGLPKSWKAPVTDLHNWPRLVQIAWQQCDAEGKTIDQQTYIIKPEGFTIPDEAAKVHRVTTERAEKEGVDLEETLKTFEKALNDSDFLVAHNISFDEKIVGAELLRKGLESQFFKAPQICTMQQSTDHCRLPGRYGKYKWPTLSELHTNLFGEDFEEAHDAGVDVEACAKCFFELKRLGVI